MLRFDGAEKVGDVLCRIGVDAQFADNKGVAVDMMLNGSWIAVVEIRWWKICIDEICWAP